MQAAEQTQKRKTRSYIKWGGEFWEQVKDARCMGKKRY
jgi:hypothetical protein